MKTDGGVWLERRMRLRAALEHLGLDPLCARAAVEAADAVMGHRGHADYGGNEELAQILEAFSSRLKDYRDYLHIGAARRMIAEATKKLGTVAS